MKKKICMFGLAMSLSMFGLVACGENSEESSQPTVEANVENNEVESVPAQSEENPVDAENADTESSAEETETSTEEAATTVE